MWQVYDGCAGIAKAIAAARGEDGITSWMTSRRVRLQEVRLPQH